MASGSSMDDVVSLKRSVISHSSTASRKRKAELRLRQLREKQEAERRSEEVKREIELQSARHEVEMAELEEEEDSEDSRSLPEVPVQEDRVKNYVNNLPVNSNSDKPCDNVTMYKIQDLYGLPKPELLSFNGNPVDYCKFISNFESNIEARVSDNRLKLNYLIQLCQGEAKFCIEDCVILSPDEGYLRAKEILKSRYGKPHLVARSHVNGLINGGAIRNNDVKGLMKLSLHMEKCHITLSQLGFLSDVNNTENLRKIVRRLPMHIRSKWAEHASGLIEQGLEPSFDHLLTFIKERSIVANTMYGYDLANEFSKQTVNSPKNSHANPSQQNKVVTLSTGSNENSTGNSPSEKYPRGQLSCVYCKEAHKLRECNKFRLIDINSKLNVIREHKMCENCMNFKHVAQDCRKNSFCRVPGCIGKHNTMFHRDSGEYEIVQEKYVAASESHCKQNQVSLRIVPVIVSSKSAQVETYALLDEGSDVTLCSDSLVQRLGVESKPCKFTLTTVNKSSQNINGREVQLQVGALNGNQVIDLQKVWSIKELPISLQSLPDQSVTGKWKHLSGIHIPKINVSNVELLIGSDTPDAFWVEEQRRGKSGEPYALKTVLGWSIIGPTHNGPSQGQGNVNFQLVSSTQLQTDKLWANDFPDVKSCGTGMSQKDRRALSAMKGTIVKDNGHYKLGLPWRDPGVSLPNNRLNGPEFLKRNEAEWPVQVSNVTLNEDDIEFKPLSSVLSMHGKYNTCTSELLNKFSDWHKLQNVVGWLLRFKQYLVEKFLQKGRDLSNKVNSKSLCVSEIQMAEIAVFKLVQREMFENDIRKLKADKQVSSSSSLKRLSPVLMDDVLRVGGRVGKSDLHVDAKHQIILPGNHHVTRILILKYHEQNAHMGPVHILSLLRQKYWIIHGLKSVKSVLGKCISCKQQLERPLVQQMGDLPEERLTPDKAPFTFVGVDYFGPMIVKSGRRHLKRYGCLFTCMTTRAVHIEIAHSLDTDSFICALRRFVSRRGVPEKIFSDNGKNFVSSEKVLRDSIRQLNQTQLAKFCTQQEIKWQFNPPYASHMGGVWERLVRSVKRALKSVIREQLLNDEALLTLVAEVEKILNDRPITQVSCDQRDPEPLSPNNLLIMRQNASFPPGVFDKHDVYCKRWWRQVQYLANIFWRRWVLEYLPTLQVRQNGTIFKGMCP